MELANTYITLSIFKRKHLIDSIRLFRSTAYSYELASIKQVIEWRDWLIIVSLITGHLGASRCLGKNNCWATTVWATTTTTKYLVEFSITKNKIHDTSADCHNSTDDRTAATCIFFRCRAGRVDDNHWTAAMIHQIEEPAISTQQYERARESVKNKNKSLALASLVN